MTEPQVKLANYGDSVCSWGYITLCEGCYKEEKETRRKGELGEKIDNPGLPAPHCEVCKRVGVRI